MRDDASVRPVAPAHPSVPRPFHFPGADGARLFAVERGAGRPVVFVHGGLADHRAALFRLAPLADRLRLITPDVRGSGRSIDHGPLTWAQLGDDIAALLDHLGLDRAVVGGVSAGCAVATAFALRHGDRCAGLALLTPAHGGAACGLNATQREGKARMHAAAERALSEGIDALLPLYDALPPATRALAREMAQGFDPASVRASTALYVSEAQPFADGAALAAITAPALLVPGSDPFHPPEVAAVFARHLRRCAQYPADDAGFADALAAFAVEAFG